MANIHNGDLTCKNRVSADVLKLLIILDEGGYDWCPSKKRRNPGRDTQGEGGFYGTTEAQSSDTSMSGKKKKKAVIVTMPETKKKPGTLSFLEPSNTRIPDFQPLRL